jgi:hypothetical protein
MRTIGKKVREKRKSITCATCGKEVSLTVSQQRTGQRFCSCKCAGKDRQQPKRVYLKCPVCSKEFFVTPATVKECCSAKCAYRLRQQRTAEKREKEKTFTLTCKTCRKPFLATPEEAERERPFCSVKCQQEQDARITSNCVFCGQEFSDFVYNFRKRKRRYCSKSCSQKDRPRVRQLPPPYPPEFNEEFKEKIRRRDNYLCVLCGKPGKDVHHINYDKFDTRMENCVFCVVSAT